ncbi:MAG: helix-turn-helix transcriptional regulator [Sphingomonadales bacterium]
MKTQTHINPPATVQRGSTDRKAKRPCAADAVHRDYLTVLGDRVRDARAQRGMTRRILSQDSGVSERYLAVLESGRGNVSIVLLREIARAMNMPLEDLVREGEAPPVELTLMLEYLRRLPATQLAQAQELLNERFGVARERDGRMALIGLRGAGKSTVGRLAARRLDVPFIELAREVEIDAGMKLDEIFSLSGQAAYRRYERSALDRVIDEHSNAIIVTGGGSVADPATYEKLLTSCFTVWLRATPEEHMNRVIEQGDRRPMAGNPQAMDDLRRILKNRQALYAQADCTIDTTDLTPDQVLTEFLDQLARRGKLPARSVESVL